MTGPTAEELDRFANEMLATGAVFAILSEDGRAEVAIASDPELLETALIVRVSFLKSAYRLTVTMEPDP